MSRRIAVVGAFHETNTFSEHPTELDAFLRRWYRGQEILTAFASSRTVIGGVLDECAARGLTPVPVFATYATPSGTIRSSAFAAMLDEIRRGIVAEGPFEGVFLELHGDMGVEGVDDPEEDIIAVVRELVGDVPISVVLDFHANVAQRRFDAADLFVGYRENPHVDTYERGREATAQLARMIDDGVRPARIHRGLPLVFAPAAQATSTGPFADVSARARALAADPAFLVVNVHGGYAYLDAPYTGVGITAFVDPTSIDVAEAAMDDLFAFAASRLAASADVYPDPAEAVALASAADGVTAIADTGDNINGGSPGDTTWLAAAALAHPNRWFLTTICDPAAVELLADHPVGARVAVELGGRSGASAGQPLRGDVTVLGHSDGRFVNEGPMATGARIDMGPTCWVRLDNVDIVVQSAATQPNDPQVFRHLGIRSHEYDVVILKGAAAIRAGWDPIVDGFIDAGTRGETDSVLSRLAYRRFVPAKVPGGAS